MQICGERQRVSTFIFHAQGRCIFLALFHGAFKRRSFSSMNLAFSARIFLTRQSRFHFSHTQPRHCNHLSRNLMRLQWPSRDSIWERCYVWRDIYIKKKKSSTLATLFPFSAAFREIRRPPQRNRGNWKNASARRRQKATLAISAHRSILPREEPRRERRRTASFIRSL